MWRWLSRSQRSVEIDLGEEKVSLFRSDMEWTDEEKEADALIGRRRG